MKRKFQIVAATQMSQLLFSAARATVLASRLFSLEQRPCQAGCDHRALQMKQSITSLPRAVRPQWQRLCVAALVALVALPAAQAQLPPQTPPPPPTSKFLIPLMIAAATPVLQAGMGCVFERLFSFMGANPSAACAQPNQAVVLQGAQNPGMNPAAMGTAALLNQAPAPAGAWTGPPGAWTGPPGAPAAGSQAQVLAGTPVFSFIVNKLSDATPQAVVTQSVQFANAQQGANQLGFDVRTGEAFAILFATSVPGRVRLINTDVDRQVTSSDVYEALPGADNRMPRDWQGGIGVAGRKGIEYLDVEFAPCLSPQYLGDPRVAMFQGLLPMCTQETAVKRFAPALLGGKGGPAEAGAKAMVFPGSPNPGQPIGLAPANYAKGDALTFRITINHQ